MATVMGVLVAPTPALADDPSGAYRGTTKVTAYEPIPGSSQGAGSNQVGSTFNGTYRVTCSGGGCTLEGALIGNGPLALSGGGGKWTGEIARPSGDECPPHSPITVAVSGDEKRLTVTITSHYHRSVCSASHYTEITGTTYVFTGTAVAPPATVPATTAPGTPATSAPGANTPVPTPALTKLNRTQQASAAAVARGKRSTVTAALTRPADALDGGLGHVAKNAALAALIVLLLVFPSQLFNSTYSANQDRVDAGLRKLLPWRAKAVAVAPIAGDPLQPAEPDAAQPEAVSTPFARQLAVFGVVAVLGALLGQFLDPNVKVDAKTVALFVGILIAIAIDKLVDAGVGRAFRGAVHQSTVGVLKSAPLGLLVALGCVVVSRATHFQPGYLYGLIGGWAFTTAMEEEDEGRQALVAVGVGLLVALAAWFVFPAVADSANEADPGLVVLVADSVLAGMFIGGVEGLLFGLTPLRFMPGHTLSKWSWTAWVVAAFAVAFVFVQVLLNPDSGYLGRSTSASIVVTCALFAGFGVASILFWGWFQTHPDPESSPPVGASGGGDPILSGTDVTTEPDVPPLDSGGEDLPPAVAPA